MTLEEFLRSWVPLAVSIIALGTSGWGILQGPARKNADAIRALADNLGKLIERLDLRMDATEKDVAGLKATVQQLPTATDFHSLDKGIMELRGDLKTMAESQGTTKASLARIENVLISMAGTK